MANNTNKYFTWYVKSRNKVCTFLGADEFDGFVSRQWTDRNGRKRWQPTLDKVHGRQ